MVFLPFLEANSSNLYTRRKKETIWEQIIYANESGLKLYGVAWCCQAIIVNVGLTAFRDKIYRASSVVRLTRTPQPLIRRTFFNFSGF